MIFLILLLPMILQLFCDYWNLLEVYAKVLCEVAPLQDEELGDGTTSLIILTAEILKNADEFAKQKTSVIAGYCLLYKEACEYISKHLIASVDKLGRDTLINIVNTSMSSNMLISS